MPQRDAKIVELRKYDDPSDETASLYDVLLPATSTDAVFDSGGNSLEQILAAIGDASDKVSKSGDTMAGQLNTIYPIADANAANKKYVDDTITDVVNADHTCYWCGDASVTASVYTLTPDRAIASLYNGLRFSFYTSVANAMPLLGIKGVNGGASYGPYPLLKGDLVTAEPMTAGVHTVICRSNAFFLSSGGGGGYYGSAGAAQVLTGYTVGTPGGVIPGTMPNNGAASITPSESSQPIAMGYWSGGSVAAIPSNYRKSAPATVVQPAAPNNNRRLVAKSQIPSLSGLRAVVPQLSATPSQGSYLLWQNYVSSFYSTHSLLRTGTGLFFETVDTGTTETIIGAIRSYAADPDYWELVVFSDKTTDTVSCPNGFPLLFIF